MKRFLVCVIVLLMSVSAVMCAEAESSLLAFPGAEGGGKYSLGARGILESGGQVNVYHVTNLNSSGSGSFADAVSQPGRIIVFDISGTIELSRTLTINSSNLTILGQTAPGDGITISGGDIVLNKGVENIIIRYLKVRPTDKNGGEPDGIGGRYNSNVIIDHCSASWGVDELLSLYAGSSEDGTQGDHITMQNTIGAESLRMSNHVKGAHGYGAIWGGTSYSYLYNLLAHHDSRSPRLDRELQNTEVSNNIIYDWGQTNSAYGAEPYSTNAKTFNPSYVNWVGNYYKPGPATASKLLTRIFDISAPLNTGDPKSKFYFSDTYIEGIGIIDDYHNNSYVNNYSGADLLDSEIDMGEYSVEKMSAQEAYEYVLNNVGATLPRRDAIDARIVNDVKNGTGHLVNNADEVGGLIPVVSEQRVYIVPAEWLAANGLSGRAETDIIESGDFAGYTVIEAYVNDWTEEQSKMPPTNPNIIVQSPAISALSDNIDGYDVDNGEWTVVTEGESIDYRATAIAAGGNEVTKMELYDGNTKIDEFSGSIIDVSVTLEPGEHYLTCRAYNTRGEQTQSTASIVYVKAASEPGSYSFAEVRESSYTSYAGKGGASMDDNGVYTIYGSGRITTKANDSCGFMYKPVTGDFDITVKVEDIPKFENQQVSGLMVRASLDSNSIMAMIGDGWLKYGENVRVFSRAATKAPITETYFKDANGVSCENTNSVSYAMPKYMRIQRSGNTLTFSVSNSGFIWTDNQRQPMTITYDSLPDTMYVGLATDSAYGVSVKEYFSIAKFSSLTLNGSSDVETEDNSVPFCDERFNTSDWYVPTGEGERDLSSSPLGGNDGYALMFWGVAARSFTPQDKGIVDIAADYYVKRNSASVDAKAGIRIMLNGLGDNGEFAKIKSIYAQHNLGFFVDYDDTGNPVPNIVPDSSAAMDFDRWYRIEMQLDYNTGKGKYSFKPYSDYEAQSLEKSIYDYEFDFDTSIPVVQLHFQRCGGYEMFVDNVSVTVSKVLSKKNGRLIVDNPESDATLYIASYDSSGILTDVDIEPVKQGEYMTFDIPDAYDVKAFLWNENQNPLCKAEEL